MKETLFLRLKVTPGCSKTEFSSEMDDGCFKIRLKAPPVDGRANTELIQWISKQFGIQRSAVLIKSGSTSGRKTLKITSPQVSPDWYHD